MLRKALEQIGLYPDTPKKWAVVFAAVLILLLTFSLEAYGRQQHASHRPTTLMQKRTAYLKQLRGLGAQVIQLGETVKVVLPSDRLFNTDSANVRNPNMLRALTHYIKTFRTVDIAVDGYSDRRRVVGHPQNYQDALTAQQAQVVIDRLWSRGIDTRLLVAEGQGWRNAVAWNGSEAGRRQNRRIEVTFRFYPEYRAWD